MGTETIFLLVEYVDYFVMEVKLNNPLMGTETYTGFLQVALGITLVKLNNPLMGTETLVLHIP